MAIQTGSKDLSELKKINDISDQKIENLKEGALNYFFHDEEGAHVTTQPNNSKNGPNVLINAAGMHIRKDEEIRASFTDNGFEFTNENVKFLELRRGNNNYREYTAAIIYNSSGVELQTYDEIQQGEDLMVLWYPGTNPYGSEDDIRFFYGYYIVGDSESEWSYNYYTYEHTFTNIDEIVSDEYFTYKYDEAGIKITAHTLDPTSYPYVKQIAFSSAQAKYMVYGLYPSFMFGKRKAGNYDIKPFSVIMGEDCVSGTRSFAGGEKVELDIEGEDNFGFGWNNVINESSCSTVLGCNNILRGSLGCSLIGSELELTSPESGAVAVGSRNRDPLGNVSASDGASMFMVGGGSHERFNALEVKQSGNILFPVTAPIGTPGGYTDDDGDYLVRALTERLNYSDNIDENGMVRLKHLLAYLAFNLAKQSDFTVKSSGEKQFKIGSDTLTGTFRRSGNVVMANFIGTMALPSKQLQTFTGTIPTGYRPAAAFNVVNANVVSNNLPAELARINLNPAGSMQIISSTAVNTRREYHFSATYITTNAMPS